MLRLSTLALAVSLGMSLGGCATIIEGTSQSVAVTSDPAGASCSIDRQGQHLGQVAPTPGSLRVDKSKNDLTLVCSHEGYQTATISHSPKFVGTTFGNIVAGGVVGVIVDASTGANFEYPSEIKVPLAPIAPLSPVPAPSAAPQAAATPPQSPATAILAASTH